MKVIDLSKEIYSGMPVYPNDPEVEISIFTDYKDSTWQLRKLSFGSHTGSHVDAFSHMHPGMASLDDLSLDRFFGVSQVVNQEGEWPCKTGLFFIEAVDIDLFDKIITCRPLFVGGNISEPLERKLLENKIITYTNLVNLDLIPKQKDFMFYGLPLKIREGDGSPVRAMAIIE